MGPRKRCYLALPTSRPSAEDFKRAMGMPAVDGGLSAQGAHMSKYLFPEAIQELLVTPLEHLPAYGPRLSLPTFDDFEKAGEDLDYIKKRIRR
eukprot:6533600-Pyramimonas_sp.AAC.1